MAKKRYSYPVGICGPTILYTTIYAENAEEAARIRFEEKYDSFSEEQKKNVISYFEEQDNQRNNKKKKTQEKQLMYQLLPEEEFPKVEEADFAEEVKDAVGNTIKQGDIVAVVHHPEAYKFYTRAAVVVGKTGQYIMTKLLGTGDEVKFKVGKDGISFPKVVRIRKDFPVTGDDECVDSLGHAIHIGDTVAFRRLPEAGGNTQKGFENGGIVTRMTDRMVFFKNEEGVEKRKGFSSIVVY